MKGKLYGIGIGPGDPELLTLKAVRLIKEADILAVPGNDPRESVAYQIVKSAFEYLERTEIEMIHKSSEHGEIISQFLNQKEVLAIPMPMTKDKEILEQSHSEGARRITKLLDQGKIVAFLTLGDPTVYSTYLYIHKKIVAEDYEAEIVSGVPSFCAVAARLNMGLAEQAEPLHIIPATYETGDLLKLSGTKVLMKAGKNLVNVKKDIQAMDAEAVMIENCGMPNEKIYQSIEEIPETAGYYSLLIVKEKKQES